MRKNILFLLLLVVFGIKAQNKTILIAEAQLPYTSQTWFYSGRGNGLQESNIKKHWDEGRRITSVAYTANGWFVTMAKDTGIGMQTYSYSADWPKDWISKKWDENYYITSISKGNGMWCVVMSQGIGYLDQSWCRDDDGALLKWYNEKRDKGYFMTNATYNGEMWTFVMSKGSPYSVQGYLWANSYDDLLSKVKKDIWDKSYRIHLIEYGAGFYLVVYGNYSKNDGRGQNYIVDPSDVESYIDKRWEESYNIAHIGGGYALPSNNTYTNSQYNGYNSYNSYNGGGYMPYQNNNSNYGGGNNSNSRRVCPGCNGTGKGADQITYQPNYTGRDNSRYCSQCGKVAPAHSHRRPMCRVCYGKGYVD